MRRLTPEYWFLLWELTRTEFKLRDQGTLLGFLWTLLHPALMFIVLIGFAMEDHDHKAHAQAKLKRKGCDAIVLNSVATAGAPSGCIEVYDPRRGWCPPVSGTKQKLARAVVAVMEDLLLGRWDRT